MLLPEGAVNINEMPADLSDALSHALLILSWQKNLSEDEMPPRWMWSFNDELERWFDEVTRKRENKYSSNSDDDSGDMMRNEIGFDR